jgi:hypothetical protein
VLPARPQIAWLANEANRLPERIAEIDTRPSLALVWLTDVAGLTRQQASKLMRWSPLAVLRAALAEDDHREPSP